MLSASTLSSNASDAFSTNSGAQTPISPYSTNSTPKVPGGSANPLTELIETEKNYMETLKIIDMQLAPLWTNQSIIDFTELINGVREIIEVNQRFCVKLVKIAANPQTIKELGDVLMHWIDDMEVPYANFSRGYITNLNKRQDIINQPGIQKLLHDISTQASYEITLESLFNAPVQQLKYYKVLYSRLLESAEPGRADHKLLVKANRRIDTVMLMAQKISGISSVAGDPSSSPSSSRAHTKPLPIVTPIQTDMTSVRSEFITFDGCKLDCSQIVDLFSGSPMPQYQPRLPNDAATILRNHFVQLPGETNETTPIRVQLILTNEILLIAKEVENNNYALLYPPLAVNDITVKSINIDRELVGEYIAEFTVAGKKHLAMRADNKEIRNKWIGVDEHAPSSLTLSPKQLRMVVQKHAGVSGERDGAVSVSNATARKSMFKPEVFTYYTDQTGEISPLSSDESDTENFRPQVPSFSTLMKEEKTQHESKTLPAPPPPPKVNGGSDLKPQFHHQQQQKEMNNHHLSPARSASPAPSAASTSTFNSSAAEDSPGAAARPVSPRTIEISHAVAPVAAMQAVTQDFAATSLDSKPAPRTSSTNRSISPAPMGMPARTSSSLQQQQQSPMQKALPQQPPAAPQHHQPGGGPLGTPMHNNSAMNRSLPPQPQQQQRPPVIHQPQPQYMSHPGTPPAVGGAQQASYFNGMSGNRSSSPGMHGSAGPGGYPQQQPTPPPQQQQPMGRHLNTPPHLHPQRSMDDLNSPPRSPTPHMVNGQPTGIRQVLYSGRCEVFHWKSESWYAVDGQCMLEVRQTFTNRSSVAILMQNTGQLYLNAWILPNTIVTQASPTDVSISVFMGNVKENYLVHYQSPQEAIHLSQVLQHQLQESIRMGGAMGEGTLRGGPPAGSMSFLDEDPKDDEPPAESQQPQSLRLVMQCKTKLFVQQEHSSWSSFGSVALKISQQLPSKKMHVEMENGKGNKATKLVSATVHSRNVTRINPKRITMLLVNEKERQSMVYMIQFKEEQTGQKIFDYLKTKNAENGW
ncbi:hypothetical protein INT45_006768 [Circinella minor]|uniref:DH domain-containing protein n=1 Tax=Circinella minor TaxID=1195481 RepID=A0A8H7SAB7_9FUNG|nr:hypothetical protein INT45_006768 [Circinella minor]